MLAPPPDDLRHESTVKCIESTRAQFWKILPLLL
jgi:hypothetical protein